MDPLAAFSGRIIPSAVDTACTEITGKHTVLYPASAADVKAALALARISARPVILRSGSHAVTCDVVDGSGAVVIDMKRLRGLSVAGTRVTVGPGTTVEALADRLVVSELFLPIQENQLQSVVGSVLSDEPGCLLRCAGALKKYVARITAVLLDGTDFTAAQGDPLFESLLEADYPAVITALEFNALSKQDAAKFWMVNITLPYTKSVFTALLSRTFTHRERITSDVDVVLKATAIILGFPVIVVTVAGNTGGVRDGVLAEIISHIASTHERFTGPGDASQISHHTFVGVDVVKAISDAGELGGFNNGLESTRHARKVTAAEFPQFSDKYSKLVTKALGTNAEGEIYFPNITMSTRLVLDEESVVNASAYFFTPVVKSPLEARLLAALDKLLPRKMSKPAVLYFDDDDEILDDERGEFAASPEFDVAGLAAAEADALIPGFTGPIFTPADGQNYIERAHQYATSSYPAADMTPFMVAYPQSVADIQTAIAFAKREGKKIVARSGGHQYSGLSSGGQSTIVLSMDYRQDVTVVGSQATLGVGARLTKIADTFKEHGVTVPHGECPLVCIGGHAQSGGYGHILRSFGLALDYVHSFEIVIGDGSVQTVVRPANGEQGLFWAVLGGGPSSFGVITSFTFNAIRDADHPLSRGYRSTRLFQKDIFHAVMKTVQDWTVAIKSNDKKMQDGTVLPDDLDVMFSAVSVNIPGRRFLPNWFDGVILMELVYGDASRGASKAQSLEAQRIIDSISERLSEKQGLFNPTFVGDDGERALSYMSDSFVRRTGTTQDGREFKYPYEKRLNGTEFALTDGFVNGFVDLVARTIHDNDVRLVFQMGLGGGMHSGNPARRDTSCSRRDLAFQVVYDVFYTEGNRNSALKLQNEMKDLLNKEFRDGDSKRLFWGSYGNTNIDEVWQYYVDSESLYKQLQNVKKDVDVDDVFHTRFTIPVASRQ